MSNITLDFETYYDKVYSLSKITTEAYIRDKQFEVIGFGYKIDNEPAVWVTGDHDAIKAELDRLELHKHNLICHNTAFDGAILAWRFGIIPKYYFDTLSMARPVTGATVGGSLAALAKKFMLGEKGTEVVQALGKRRKEFAPYELSQYGEYCKNDVNITWALFNILKQYSTSREMYIIDLMLRMYTDPVLELDAQELTNHLTRVQLKKKLLMAKISDSIGLESLMSNDKFAEVLRQLGVEPPTKISPATKKEAYAFAKTDTAFKALLEHDDPRVQAVVSARLGVKSTLEETRTESFLAMGARGRLPIMLNYYGAHTGRASGGDKVNLQNLPRGGALRRSIKAPQGHKLIACDSAQIEARVVAWFAGEDDLVQAFRDKEDIYSKFASQVYNRPINRKRKEIVDGKEVFPDFVEGFVGKTCILGLGYGMGKDKFHSTLKIGQAGVSVDMSLADCERVVSLYRQTYSKIAALWKDGQAALEAMSKGFSYELGVSKLLCNGDGIHLPNGMLLRYANLRKDAEGQYVYDTRYGPNKIYGGKVIENVVQALARIVVFDQMAKIDQELRKLDSDTERYRVVLTVHDEVVVVVPDHAVDHWKQRMLELMSVAPKWCSDLPVACEAESGLNYADCK
jgi:DNA polymerase